MQPDVERMAADLCAKRDRFEQVARAAAGGGRWSYFGSDDIAGWTLYDEHWSIASITTYDTESYNYSERMPAVRNPSYVDPDANGRHIALNDPDRVLGLVAAHRAMLDELEAMPHYAWDGREEYGCPMVAPDMWRDPTCLCGRDAFVERMVRHLAAAYADRDGNDGTGGSE